jgi:hypothetical protein
MIAVASRRSSRSFGAIESLTNSFVARLERSGMPAIRAGSFWERRAGAQASQRLDAALSALQSGTARTINTRPLAALMLHTRSCPMNRLRRLIEISHEERTGRSAYVLRRETLPLPMTGSEWVEDSSFNAAEAVLADPSLKDVFASAIANGYAIVEQARPSPKTRYKPTAAVYTLEIDGKPVVSFEAKNHREAQELVKEAWFRNDLTVLTVGGLVLWNGKAALRIRTATEPEGERYRNIAAEAEEESGDILLAFLVTLDRPPQR